MNDSSEETQKPPEEKNDREKIDNILKTRDDHGIVCFQSRSDGKFVLSKDSECSWVKGSEFGFKELRQRIEPWLTSLFQSEHLSLMMGSGLMYGIHKMATGDAPSGGMGTPFFSEHQQQIHLDAQDTAMKAHRGSANFEDCIRSANELLRGLEILNIHMTVDKTPGKTIDQSKTVDRLRTEICNNFEKFADSILLDELSIINSDGKKREKAFNSLINFLMSFASRTGTRDRLSIFTTNYDRLIEAGAELAGLHLLDRFLGNLMPIFRSSRLDLDMHYNPPGIRGEPRYLEGVARFTKLHGSLDWVQTGDEIRRMGLPFGDNRIETYLKAPYLDGATAHQLMIYPNSAKDRETAHYPYVELFRDFAAAICRPNSTLIIYGYSFGDEHINRVIKDMLTIPSTHLVIISYDDFSGRIMDVYYKLGRPSQITLLIGESLGDLKTLVDNFLPKPAIDRATFRLSEILKNRFGTHDFDDNAGVNGKEKETNGSAKDKS
jgi:hypothetical protein